MLFSVLEQLRRTAPGLSSDCCMAYSMQSFKRGKKGVRKACLQGGRPVSMESSCLSSSPFVGISPIHPRILWDLYLCVFCVLSLLSVGPVLPALSPGDSVRSRHVTPDLTIQKGLCSWACDSAGPIRISLGLFWKYWEREVIFFFKLGLLT